MRPAPVGLQLGGGIVVAVGRGGPGRCDLDKHTLLASYITYTCLEQIYFLGAAVMIEY